MMTGGRKIFRSAGLGAARAGLLMLLAASFGSIAVGQPAKEPRAALWRATQAAMAQGLPKTALTNVQEILEGALADKAYPEAAKAAAMAALLGANADDDPGAGKIVRLQKALTTSPRPEQPLLHAILGHWYWDYYEQHRWQFAARTSAATNSEDFTTWPLTALFGEIGRQFQAALAEAKALQSIPVADWGALLEKGSMPDACRPTLYDFLAGEAIGFETESQRPETPEKAFEISAKDPIFDSVDAFLAWAPKTKDTNAPLYQALRLWQDALRFHAHDAAPATALAWADLDRLTWAWNVATGEKNARCLAALRAFIAAHAGEAVTADARERAARILRDEGNNLEAHRLAEEGAREFPDSPGGKLCHNLLLEIEAKGVMISTERLWNAPFPKIHVNYWNVDAVKFQAIPVNWEMFLERRHHRPENLSEEERTAILAIKPALTWTAALPGRADYNGTNFDTPAPATLKPGFYVLAASHETNGKRDSEYAMAPIWVTELALTVRSRGQNLEGFVTKARSGEPVTGAAISAWHLDANGHRVAEPSLTTDANGFFTMKTAPNLGYLVRARSQGNEIANVDDVYLYAQGEPAAAAFVYFYTDREIYRPGQTIQYMGLCLKSDAGGRNCRLAPGHEVTVVLQDGNQKEIGRQTLRANDYGSVQGSFTPPRNILTGQLRLTVEGEAEGQAFVNVEEYKRPKFETTMDAPKEAPRLNEMVKVTGHATAYTGAAIDGAAVSYHVRRRPRFPLWWSWWHPRESFAEVEIAHGTTVTAADGTFAISFEAEGDASISPTNEPTFEFQVDADVTDNAGETRSATRFVRVGYAALKLEATADDWQTPAAPVKIKISTTTLDDEPQPARGMARVYTLRQPAHVTQPPLEGPPENGPTEWPPGRVVAEKPFTTGPGGETNILFDLEPGVYRAVLETTDRLGRAVTAKLPLQVIDPQARALPIKVTHLLAAPRWEAQPGEDFVAVWGTGYPRGRACIEILHDNKIVEQYWTERNRTEQLIKFPVTEEDRGGFTLVVTEMHENRAFYETRKIDVPWKNKELTIKWEHFTSKLQPGRKETWTAVISGPKAERTAVEMAATLYDESLDAFAPLEWDSPAGIFHSDNSEVNAEFANRTEAFSLDFSRFAPTPRAASETFRHFPGELVVERPPWQEVEGVFSLDIVGYANLDLARNIHVNGGTAMTANPLGRDEVWKRARFGESAIQRGVAAMAGEPPAAAPAPANLTPAPTGMPNRPINLGQVSARKNLNETAFFFPQLMSDSNGVVRVTFEMPEALTKWHFLGLAHDRELRSGLIEAHAVTAKDLMIQPNPPRFLREGDTIEFSVKVSNRSDADEAGAMSLTFNDAATEAGMDTALENTNTEQRFLVPAKESRAYFWRIHVPDGCGFLRYKAVAATEKVSDGEEGAIPVLSRRVLVTESLPLWVRGPGTNRFRFDKLLASGGSGTLRSEDYVVQMASNPAWYAVLALPYLMEFPHECSEQVFDRLYANALARRIARSDSRIRRVFDWWENTKALDSPLEKNQELKAVAREETPWALDAEGESLARRQIGILFDSNRLDDETSAGRRKLMAARLEDGRWPWFPGGPGDDFITLYIVSGFGRLRHLGAEIEMPAVKPSVEALDKWMEREYERIEKTAHPEAYAPSHMDCLYLYARSFFRGDIPIEASQERALAFLLGQARKFWLETGCRQSQGQLALALHRWGGAENMETARAIMKSLKERSVTTDELGMRWNDEGASWWWYRAPIETQALMIEAFDEVTKDSAAVEACQVWLLKQKQTENWKTTKATADAVYALLLRGANLLGGDRLVRMEVGGVEVAPAPGEAEAGTGFYEKRFPGPEVKPALGGIVIKKEDAGIAWGGAHWQYFEDAGKVTPNTATPLKLTKAIFVKVNTTEGAVLKPVDGAGPLHVGDELVVRIELRTDRDMEYLDLKDERGSGVEPVNVLSGYKFQDGLGYYESTQDTASHFFIDHLPKGTYVFEYSARVQLRGEYESGLAEIQCLYAPEFNSHSESFALKVE